MASQPRTTRERTYRTMYVADVGGVPGNDHVVFNHPNGLCVVCLSERHPLCATAADDAPACVSVDWSCGKDARRGGRADASGGAKPLDPCAGVRGKKKRGAKLLMPDSGLATLERADGKRWTARALARGKLLEVNERLRDEPKLVSAAPTDAGFLAVIEPGAEALAELEARAMTPEAYERLRGDERLSG